jgi:hypothetical protein
VTFEQNTQDLGGTRRTSRDDAMARLEESLNGLIQSRASVKASSTSSSDAVRAQLDRLKKELDNIVNNKVDQAPVDNATSTDPVEFAPNQIPSQIAPAETLKSAVNSVPQFSVEQFSRTEETIASPNTPTGGVDIDAILAAEFGLDTPPTPTPSVVPPTVAPAPSPVVNTPTPTPSVVPPTVAPAPSPVVNTPTPTPSVVPPTVAPAPSPHRSDVNIAAEYSFLSNKSPETPNVEQSSEVAPLPEPVPVFRNESFGIKASKKKKRGK